jgi:hypothetical protein
MWSIVFNVRDFINRPDVTEILTLSYCFFAVKIIRQRRNSGTLYLRFLSYLVQNCNNHVTVKTRTTRIFRSKYMPRTLTA